jgi:hypothetical protein
MGGAVDIRVHLCQTEPFFSRESVTAPLCVRAQSSHAVKSPNLNKDKSKSLTILAHERRENFSHKCDCSDLHASPSSKSVTCTLQVG